MNKLRFRYIAVIIIDLLFYVFLVWMNLAKMDDVVLNYGTTVRMISVIFVVQAVLCTRGIYQDSHKYFKDGHLLRAIAYGAGGFLTYPFYMGELTEKKYALAKEGKVNLYPDNPTNIRYVLFCWVVSLFFGIWSSSEIFELIRSGVNSVSSNRLEQSLYGALIAIIILVYTIFETRKLATGNKKKNPLDDERPLPAVYGVLITIFVIGALVAIIWYGSKMTGTKIFDF